MNLLIASSWIIKAEKPLTVSRSTLSPMWTMVERHTIMVVTWMKKIPYSGNFRERKLLRVWKKIFTKQTFTDCSLMLPKNGCAPKFCRENFRKYPQNHKTRESFLPRKFPISILWLSHGYVNMLLCSC